jgi:DNA-directed RNA polymerase subunit H (RpoH/RPB5)
LRDEQEIAKVMEAYGLKSRHQLPLIMLTDPMARYLGLHPGQLVRVTRSSPAAGEYVLYRCCV